MIRFKRVCAELTNGHDSFFFFNIRNIVNLFYCSKGWGDYVLFIILHLFFIILFSMDALHC